MDACHEYTGCSFPHNGFDGRGRGHGAANEIDRRGPEIYGAETLPILIRLPDLTLANRAVTRLSASAVPEEVTATVTDPVVAAPDLSPPRHERERYATGAVRQDRQVYGGRRCDAASGKTSRSAGCTVSSSSWWPRYWPAFCWP